MNVKTIKPDSSISLFVKNIFVFEETAENQRTILPFFADGYPGLMYQETANGLLVKPHNKQMPLLFLYGQTIQPIELVIEGTCTLIVFQLFPFVLKSFFNLSAKEMNNDCYDLQSHENGAKMIAALSMPSANETKINLLSNLLLEIFRQKKATLDLQIRTAIQLIIDNNGQLTIKHLCKKILTTERTFERRFKAETGISAKQFSGMIQFQRSLQQLTRRDYTKLTDVVYSNGYTDQSHFIKVFKAFTGKTPKAFK